jgi:hypothetical protein
MPKKHSKRFAVRPTRSIGEKAKKALFGILKSSGE